MRLGTLTLDWVMGTFCAIIGALMLIAPHQFASPVYAGIQPQILWWGAVFIMAGGGLFTALVFTPGGPVHIAARLLVGAILLLLSAGLVRAGGTSNIGLYGFLGATSVLAAFVRRAPDPAAPPRDLCALIVGVNCLIAAASLLRLGTAFTTPLFLLLQPAIQLGLLLGGIALIAAQLAPLRSRALVWTAHLIPGITMLTLMATIFAPQRLWAAAVYYGVFGAATAALPWLGPRLRRVDPGGLWLRLAYAFAMITALPLIASLTLTTSWEGERATERALVSQQNLARAAAAEVESIVRLGSPVDSTLFADRLASYVEPNTALYLVGPDGAVLARLEQLDPAPQLDPAADVVAALRSEPSGGGAFRFTSSGRRWLAGVARASSGTLVVARPTAAVLRDVRAGHEYVFVLLVGSVAAATLVGLITARLLTRPLRALSLASEALARGDGMVVIPRSPVTEVAQLAASFESLRADLASRTAERDAADRQLAQTLVAERQARAEAQEAVQLRDTFFSVAAHELRTPLTALLGQAQLVLRRTERAGAADERTARSLHVIVAQAQRLHRMIAALLDVTRLEHQRLSLERHRFDIAALVRRIAAEIEPTVGDHLLLVEAPDEPLTVDGDELRLEQVVQNLLQNATKYSPAGTTVRVRVEGRGEQVAIVVTDEGIGIPSEALPRLFQRFYRAPNAQQSHMTGLGVGLFVVKEIVELHGGVVTVASREGAGSTFTVTLPAADAPEELYLLTRERGGAGAEV